MDRRVTSPTRGPPPACKEDLILLHVANSKILKIKPILTALECALNNEITCTSRSKGR